MRNLTQEIKQMKIQILEACGLDGQTAALLGPIYYSSSPNSLHRNEVAVILEESLALAVRNFLPLSEQVMLLQLRGNPLNINIIQVYAPTANKEHQEVKKFYEQVDEALSKRSEINIIMEDFNAKVGCTLTNKMTGQFRLGEENEKGTAWCSFSSITTWWFRIRSPNCLSDVCILGDRRGMDIMVASSVTKLILSQRTSGSEIAFNL